MKIVSITPAYKEENTVGEVIRETKKYVDYSVVVDDCSGDNTWVEALNGKADVVIIQQENHGQGYSLRTAMKFALHFNPDAIASVDADKQHDPKKVPELVKPILEEGFDIVVGSRLLNTTNQSTMPLVKRVGNFGLNLITRLLFGIYCSDSQSGFRAYSPNAAKKLEFLIHRYGWASLMFAEISEKRLHYKEISIECVYHDPHKGTTVWDGLWIGVQLFNYKRMHLQKRLFQK